MANLTAGSRPAQSHNLGAGGLEPPLISGERRRVQLAFLEILHRKLELRLHQVKQERRALLSGPPR